MAGAARLRRVPGLLPIRIDVDQPYALDGTALAEIGRSLEAEAVVEGSLDWRPSDAGATARVIDVSSGEVLWEISHDH